MKNNYLEVNKASWNTKTDVHVNSDFYDMEKFLKTRDSLNHIEKALLGDVKGKSILHLQCHFGQDSLSLAQMGAQVTGVDLSNRAIAVATDLSHQLDLDARFIESDVYSLDEKLEEKFDVVFTSYGTVTWLPDVTRWAEIISHFLKPGGQFVFVEFHPAMWMFDDDFTQVTYRYFTDEPIVEQEVGTYGDRNADISTKSISWNHALSEIIGSLLQAGLRLDSFDEFDYSVYDCFNGTIEVEKGRWRIEKLGNKMPLMYSLKMTKMV